MGGAFALALILIFFWMPETAFVRKDTINLDTGSNDVSFDEPLSPILAHKLADYD
jgi:hypothetical protein